MSDPSAIIAAIVIAAGGAVSNTDLPPEVKAPVTDTVAAIEEAAPALDRQVGDVLATLPAPYSSSRSRVSTMPRRSCPG